MVAPTMVANIAWKTYLVFMVMVRPALRLKFSFSSAHTSLEFRFHPHHILRVPRDSRSQSRGDRLPVRQT